MLVRLYHLSRATDHQMELRTLESRCVHTFGYDAFGNVRFSQGMGAGIAGGDFRFQGQWLESATGIYHFRARDYDARTGTFLSRDPVDPTEQDPEALNPYQAMYNNPYVYSDPSGMITLVELNGVLNTQTVLNSARTAAFNEVKQHLIDKTNQFVSNLAFDALTAVIPGLAPIKRLLDMSNDENRFKKAGNDFENLITGKFCEIFAGSGYLHYVHFETPINARTGNPSGNGIGCDTGLRDLAKDALSLHPDPRPDFLLKDGKPLDTSSKGWAVGDVKLAVKTIIESYTGQQANQWKAMVKYAKKHEEVPIVSFITWRAGRREEYARVMQAALKAGVIVPILSIWTPRSY